MISCERCGRQAGPDIISCSERASGNCPYVILRSSINPSSGWPLLLFGTILAIPTIALANMLIGSPPSPYEKAGFILGAALFSLMAMGSLGSLIPGAYLALGRRVTLHNPDTGAMWRRNGLWGIAIERVMLNDLEPLALSLNLPQSLRFPASIAALGALGPSMVDSRSRATLLFQTALVGLLAQHTIELKRARVTRSRLGLPARRLEGTEFLIVPRHDAHPGLVNGTLEQRIVQTLASWSSNPAARVWPQGATIYELVRAIIQYDQHSPDMWLLRLAQDEAVSRGMSRLDTRLGGMLSRHEIGPPYSGQILGEGQVIQTLLDQLAHSQPDFARALEAEIGRGIESRRLKWRTPRPAVH